MRFSLKKPRRGLLEFEKAVLVVSTPVAVLAVVMAAGARLEDSSATLCTFRRLTGHPCMTCGATRSLAALVHGRFAEAFAWNPLVTAVYLALAIGTAYSLATLAFGLPRIRLRVEGRREATVLILLVILAALANWVYVWTTQS